MPAILLLEPEADHNDEALIHPSPLQVAVAESNVASGSGKVGTLDIGGWLNERIAHDLVDKAEQGGATWQAR